MSTKLYQKFDEEGNLFVEDVFWEEYFKFAKEHQFNVVITNTHAQNFVECLKAFREAGYTDTLFEVPHSVDGLELTPYVYCKFELPMGLSLEEKIAKIKNMQQNTTDDDYDTGYYNGVEYCLSILEDREPEYREF